MILFPNAKINLGLNVLRKREDGYHDLETIFYPIPIHDIIEIIIPPAENIPVEEKPILFGSTRIYFSTSGLHVDDEVTDNLCIKACKLVMEKFAGLPDFIFHLHKNIPSGAGLGGGSSDAANTLQLMNEIFQLELTIPQLELLALQLGSDVPFFIRNTPVFAEKRGEQMENIKVALSAYSMILVHPDIHISTKQAYSELLPRIPLESLKNNISTPLQEWKDLIKNDFECLIFQKNPALATIKEQLYNSGALFSSMTGSGSAIYGIFEKNKVPVLTFPSGYHWWFFPNI